MIVINAPVSALANNLLQDPIIHLQLKELGTAIFYLWTIKSAKFSRYLFLLTFL